MAENTGRKTSKVGVVVSDKMDKTVVVAVESKVKHPLYQKYVKSTAKFFAHDESNGVKTGDKVIIEESRPLSRRKRWAVKEVVSSAS